MARELLLEGYESSSKTASHNNNRQLRAAWVRCSTESAARESNLMLLGRPLGAADAARFGEDREGSSLELRDSAASFAFSSASAAIDTTRVWL